MLYLMTTSPTRLRECVALPAWSQRELARIIGLTDRSVDKMSTDKHSVPPELEEWLKVVASVWSGLTPYQTDVVLRLTVE